MDNREELEVGLGEVAFGPTGNPIAFKVPIPSFANAKIFRGQGGVAYVCPLRNLAFYAYTALGTSERNDPSH